MSYRIAPWSGRIKGLHQGIYHLSGRSPSLGSVINLQDLDLTGWISLTPPSDNQQKLAVCRYPLTLTCKTLISWEDGCLSATTSSFWQVERHVLYAPEGCTMDLMGNKSCGAWMNTWILPFCTCKFITTDSKLCFPPINVRNLYLQCLCFFNKPGSIVVPINLYTFTSYLQILIRSIP